MKLLKLAGSTSNILLVFIQDSSSTTGAGLTGLAYNSGSLTAYYMRSTDSSATAISLVTMTAGTFTSSGFKELDATNLPGFYAFCPPDAALASGAKSVVFMLKGASNMAPLPLEIQLTAVNVDDGVHFGITGIPNAAAAASGGLLINGSNSGTVTLAGLNVTANVGLAGGLTITQSTSDTPGLSVSGNGSGSGVYIEGGSTGAGTWTRGGSASGDGFKADGAVVGNGIQAIGGSSSGSGVLAASLAGDGIKCAPVAGHGINTQGNGVTKHGINATGGATTSHGISAVGGGVGNGINAISGGGATGDGIKAASAATDGNGIEAIKAGSGKDILGTLSEVTLVDTLTTYTGNTPQTGDVFAQLPTNFVDLSIQSSTGLVTTTFKLRKNTALSVFPFVMTDSTTHAPVTGKTVTCQRSLDGAAFANCNTSTATEIANGWYYVPLAAGDTNANAIAFKFTAASCDDTDITVITQ